MAGNVSEHIEFLFSPNSVLQRIQGCFCVLHLEVLTKQSHYKIDNLYTKQAEGLKEVVFDELLRNGLESIGGPVFARFHTGRKVEIDEETLDEWERFLLKPQLAPATPHENGWLTSF